MAFGGKAKGRMPKATSRGPSGVKAFLRQAGLEIMVIEHPVINWCSCGTAHIA